MKIKSWVNRNNAGWRWIRTINREDGKIKDTRFANTIHEAADFPSEVLVELKSAYPKEKFETDEADIQQG